MRNVLLNIYRHLPIMPEREKCNPFMEYLTENYDMNSEAKYPTSTRAVSDFEGTTKSCKVSISSKLHNCIHTDTV